MKSIAWVIMTVLLSWVELSAQPGFRIELEEIVWPQAPALHSFACATHEGKWLLIGGRTNGLHGFLAPLAFPNSGRNTDIILFDPKTGQRWDQPVNVLPDSIREPLMTSNMQFYQEDSVLYIVGGYGWNADQATFITYPTLTAVNVPALSDAILNGQPIEPHLRQVRDSSFAICGAHLAKIDASYHLVFGHRFDGIYDRQDTTGFHVQRYSYADRSFRIQDNGQQLNIQWLTPTIDSVHFRRRDYNLVPQIFPDGNHGYTAFSGVFQKGINLPYLYPIDLTSDSVSVRLNQEQHLANYHCAVVPVYDSVLNAMHTVFLGGEAQYYPDSSGNIQMDSLVPFVNTISIMSRDASGQMQEFVSDTSMPGLLGSNAQFFPVDSVWSDFGGIVRLDKLQGRTLVGHFMGGIESPLPNISDTDPAMSWASPRIFEVYLIPNATSIHIQPARIPFRLTAGPNPFISTTEIRIVPEGSLPISAEVLDARGNHIQWLLETNSNQAIEVKWGSGFSAGVYFIKVRSGDYAKVMKVIKISR